MKKALLLFLSALCLSMTAAADQLAWVSEEVAQQAVQLLEKQHAVLWYCGCCDDVSKTYVKLESVSYRPVDYRDYREINYHEVWIQGVDANGHPVSTAVDLAYVHIQDGQQALCVGKALNLECDPCVENLEWECPDF